MQLTTSQPKLRMIRQVDSGPQPADLVAALRRCEPEAAAHFFRAYAPLVRRVIGKMIGADHQLQDLVQETFVQAFAKLHTLEDPAALRGWLLASAVHRAQNHRRKKKRSLLEFVGGLPELELPRWVTTPDDQLSIPLREQLHRLLSSLDDESRTVLILRHMEDCSIAEIAVAISASEATVKRRIAHAIGRVERLSSRYPEVKECITEMRAKPPAQTSGVDANDKQGAES